MNLHQIDSLLLKIELQRLTAQVQHNQKNYKYWNYHLNNLLYLCILYKAK